MLCTANIRSLATRGEKKGKIHVIKETKKGNKGEMKKRNLHAVKQTKRENRNSVAYCKNFPSALLNFFSLSHPHFPFARHPLERMWVYEWAGEGRSGGVKGFQKPNEAPETPKCEKPQPGLSRTTAWRQQFTNTCHILKGHSGTLAQPELSLLAV